MMRARQGVVALRRCLLCAKPARAPPRARPFSTHTPPKPSVPLPSSPPTPTSHFTLCLLATGVFAVLDAQNGFEGIYWLADNVGMRILGAFDPETAHDLAIWAVGRGLLPPREFAQSDADAEAEKVRLWGLTFPNAVGLAAGFDKNAEAVEGLLGMSFGFVEIGSVTPRPQPGNAKPRMFRLTDDRAVINRYGFNSHGVAEVQKRLKSYWAAKRPGRGLVGVNLGKNKETERAEDDYTVGVEWLADFADYLVINVSSPNTPGLRSLQRKGAMGDLIQAVQARLQGRTNVEGRRVPLLIKIAPDLNEEERRDIADVIVSSGIDGVIVSNTTVARPADLKSPPEVAREAGGLSGAPLRQASTQLIRDMYKLTKGKVPIVGVGGVGTGADAYEKIRAGASLVQVYSMLVYEGPGAPLRIRRELLELAKRDGFRSVQEAVGADHKHVKVI